MTRVRRGPGSPAGGQFVAFGHLESEIVLGADHVAQALPTWEVASVWARRAATFGDDVEVDIDWEAMTVVCRRNGLFCDVGVTPAIRRFWPNGLVRSEAHYCDGVLSDPAPGVPAHREFYATGLPRSCDFVVNGEFQDPPDGAAARQMFGPDGLLTWCAHFDAGTPV